MLTVEFFTSLTKRVPEFDNDYYTSEMLKTRVAEANQRMPYSITIHGNDGEVDGFAIAYERSGEFYIWMVGVSPAARGHGLARQLITDCIQEATRRTFRTATVKTHSNTPAMLRVLEQLGFAVRSTSNAELHLNGVHEQRTTYHYAFNLHA